MRNKTTITTTRNATRPKRWYFKHFRWNESYPNYLSGNWSKDYVLDDNDKYAYRNHKIHT